MSGAPAALSAMYQDAILAHYRAPHNRRAMTDATASASRSNPLCGDALTVSVRLRGEADGADSLRVDAIPIDDVAFEGQTCSIATASASMMTDAVRDRSVAEARVLVQAVEDAMRGSAAALPRALEPLRGVVPFPGRHGCALMPWLALRDCLLRESLPRESLPRESLPRN